MTNFPSIMAKNKEKVSHKIEMEDMGGSLWRAL